ncbi:MAG TPA: dienelactone hydrolase family protein [Candidatus Baltobacteraceae bacterium]|nr:dienelactone hydrolase family protein [Candidatus Baltobacteraceae bacterium]
MSFEETHATDPANATSLALNRGAFVGIAAAAGSVIGTAGIANGQTTLGQPHPPLVPEDDPAISTERVQLRRLDAVVPAYVAVPARAPFNVPSVVVIMHIWGVDTSIRDVVRRLAKAGIAAIAPDLYARFGAPSGDGSTDIDTFRPFAQKLDRKQYDGDIRAAALWLSARFPGTKTAVLGFCMGGHIALIQAMDNSDVFSAVVPFYGSLKDIDPDNIHIPVSGSYGARDTSISADDVRTFRGLLRVPNDVRVYNTAGHAFMDDQRSSYVAAAAVDAWKRTVDFLLEQLGAKNR